MIDSVPLIQNPNDAQQINASIIAMKKASRELNEKIVKLNSLNSELDKKIALLDSGLNKEIEDRKEAINSLDVSSVGGSGKYISAISETDGKIRATVSDLTSVIESGNNQPATSGGVADAIQGVISLPTDAVLHYSFDEVPDYPDGTADVRLIDNNTYDIQSTNYKFINNGGATITNSNGNAQISITGGNSTGVTIRNEYISNKIIKLKLNVSALIGKLSVLNGISTKVAEITEVGAYEICYLHNNTEETYSNLYIFCFSTGNSCTFTVEKIYIGNGSYSTPIIDNANGQFNAENNGLLPQQGMSGKGTISFDKYTYAKNTNFNIKPPYSYSLWVRINSNIADSQYLLDGRKSYVNTADEGIIITPTKAVIVGIANSDVTSGNNVVPLNEWFHIVVICNDEGTVSRYKVYINGSLINNGLTTSKSTGFEQLVVNARYADFSNYAKSDRQLDDLLIFDRALSDTEVLALYQNKANTPKYYSWADWKLNQIKNANRSIVAETRSIEEPPIEESGEEER